MKYPTKRSRASGNSRVAVGDSVASDSYEIATPKPAALIESLRAIGYDLPTAIADIVDNSISANAKSIDITFHWSGAQSWICMVDDGDGMSELKLFEAMRPGSQ